MALGRGDKAQLRRQLEVLEGPVKIDYFHQSKRQVVVPGRQERPGCELAIELYGELAELSEKITLNVYEHEEAREMAAKRGAEDAPCAVVRGELNRPLRMYGVPNGHIFVAFVRAVVLASVRKAKASTQLKRALGKLRRPARLRLFGAALEPNSGHAALAIWSTALLSPKLQADVFAIEEFGPEAQRMGVAALPTLFVDGEYPVAGVVDPIELVDYLVLTQANPSRARLNPPQPAPGSLSGWRPPPPPAGRPGGHQHGQRAEPRPADPIAQAAGLARESAATPQGMRRTAAGLIIPDR